MRQPNVRALAQAYAEDDGHSALHRKVRRRAASGLVHRICTPEPNLCSWPHR